MTLDKTQTVNLSRCERSITTVLRQNRLYSTKSETRRGRRSRQKKRRRKVASLCTPPPLKVFSVRSGNDRFGVYRVCNWPEIELSALIHPEWAAKSWPLCVFSSCVITLGRTVSTLILSWLESVSEISKWPTTGGPSAGNKENTSLFKSCLESGRGGGGGGGFGPCCLQHLDYQWKKEQPVYPRLKKGEVCESSRLVHFYYIMTLVLNFGVVASGAQNNKSHFRQVFFFLLRLLLSK